MGLSLPAALKLDRHQGKLILKRALEPMLPRDILYRTKQGFATDLAPLFRREAATLRDRLLGGPMPGSQLFDTEAIGRMIDAHASGAADHAQMLWLLLAFEGFLADLGRHD